MYFWLWPVVAGQVGPEQMPPLHYNQESDSKNDLIPFSPDPNLILTLSKRYSHISRQQKCRPWNHRNILSFEQFFSKYNIIGDYISI